MSPLAPYIQLLRNKQNLDGNLDLTRVNYFKAKGNKEVEDICKGMTGNRIQENRKMRTSTKYGSMLM